MTPTHAARGARALLVVALRPPVLGALYVLWLAWRAAAKPMFDEQDHGIGADTGRVVRAMMEAYADEIARMGPAIAGAAVAIGGALGVCAWGLVAARRLLLEQRACSPVGLAVRAAPIVVALHAWATLAAMSRSPQLYERSWYRGEPWQREVLVFATDVTTPSQILWAGVALIALYALGLPQTLVPTRAKRLVSVLTRTTRRRRRAALMLAGAAVVLLVALAPPGWSVVRPGARDARPNVLLLAADSLRPDRLTSRVMPHLSHLADDAVRFDRAYTSLPRTFASWTTLLTGRYPHHHGIRSMFARWDERAHWLDALPERLARAGYRTAVVSDYAGDMFRLADFGFEQAVVPVLSARNTIRRHALESETPLLPFLHSRIGRRLFPVLRHLHEASDASMLAADATDEICRADARPFFLTVFFSATHFPYAAPWPYYRRFTRTGYVGAFKYKKSVSFARQEMTDENVRQVRGLYDGAAASVDDAAATVLAALERCGLADSTIVVVTADHGEMLFEGDRDQGHGDTLIGDEVLHVPLVIRDPRVSGGRREHALVRDVDLAPTLYELTSTPAPTDLDGRSLAGALRGEALAPVFTFAETELWLAADVPVPPDLRLPYPTLARLLEVDLLHHDQLVVRPELTAVTLVARHRMVRDDRWKLVYAPTRAGARYQLFDTARDPEELVDVLRTEPREAARLKAELWRWMLEDPTMMERDGLLVPRADIESTLGAP